MKLSYYKLPQHLDEGKLDPVYVVIGSQDLLRELAVDALTESAVDGERTPFTYERFDGEDADGAQVAMAANLLPMLGGCRVVVVKRAQKLLEKSGELQAYIGDPSPSTILVLELEKTPDKRRKAWKAVEKTTTVVSLRRAEIDRARRVGVGTSFSAGVATRPATPSAISSWSSAPI